jgi:hypothetical protein
MKSKPMTVCPLTGKDLTTMSLLQRCWHLAFYSDRSKWGDNLNRDKAMEMWSEASAQGTALHHSDQRLLLEKIMASQKSWGY